MPDAKSSTVVVQRGVYTVARKTVDAEGNTIRETPPQWQEDIAGGSIITCPIDPERTSRCATQSWCLPCHRTCFSTISERRWASTGRTSPPSLRRCRESEVDFCQFCGEDLQKCMLCPFNSYNN